MLKDMEHESMSYFILNYKDGVKIV
ncbi:hypothetical protein PPOP_3285, partial [Paenibacillus popilliae ATCC 14706]